MWPVLQKINKTLFRVTNQFSYFIDPGPSRWVAFIFAIRRNFQFDFTLKNSL